MKKTALGLALLLGIGILPTIDLWAETLIDNGDGTTTVVMDNNCWYVFDEAKQVIDEGCEGGGTPEVEVSTGYESGGPGYDGLETSSSPEPQRSRPTCTTPNETCSPDSFKQSGSRYFDLFFCPTDCGWEAFERVSEVIDEAWNKVSLHLGAQYSTKVKGYIYTTGAGYKHGSGAPAWSGGVFKPGSNQIHVPAPQGRAGWDLEELLIHELAHFRLQERTLVRDLGEAAISNYKFLNEGIAQMMEQKLFEEGGAPEGKSSQRRRSLWVLKQVFEQDGEFMPLKSMMFRYGSNVHLFYAQSWAVASFIEDRHGSRGIDSLLEAIVEKNTTPRAKMTWSTAERMLEGSLQQGLRMSAEELRAEAEAWARDQVSREF